MSHFGGQHFGPRGEGSGSPTPAFPQLATATTAESIRDRIIAVIAAFTPSALAGDPFVRHRNEGKGRFEDWADAHPAGAFRRFQVRQIGGTPAPAVSNTDIEQLEAEFQILVAYPQTARYGGDQALDRDDVRYLDEQQIWNAIGPAGRINFSGAYPDACWIDGEVSEEPIVGDACDFAVIRARFVYVRQQR